MNVEQWVMAYKVEQDRIRAMLPDGFQSLRPVMRINTEIRDGRALHIEFNTPVEAYGKRGWINIANWDSDSDEIGFEKDGHVTKISGPFVEIEYEVTGGIGGCPAEKDNDGCFFFDGGQMSFVPSEKIINEKKFCDCSFQWKFAPGDAGGQSNRETLPAFMEEAVNQYERQEMTAANAAAIPYLQVLGTYVVEFERKGGE